MRRFSSIAIAMLVVACQAAPAPSSLAPDTPVATTGSTATPVPTPDAADIAAAFLDLAWEKGVPLRATYSGEIDAGPIQFKLISHELVDAGDDERADVHMEIEGAERRSTIIRLAGASYLREDELPWIRLEADEARCDAFDLFDAVEAVDFDGVVTRDGRTLYRFVPTNEVTLTPGVLHLNLAGLDSLELKATRFEILTNAEGVPAFLAIALDVRAVHQGQAVIGAAHYEYSFSQVGEPVTIDPPDEVVWTPIGSERFDYSMAHPEDWRVEEDPAGVDRFVAPWGDYLLVTRFTVAEGATLDAVMAAVIANYQVPFGGIEPDSVAEAEVAGHPAGIVDFLGEFAFADGPAPLHLLAAVIVVPDGAYELTWIAEPGMEDVDRELFNDFLETFACSC